jgi:hypothetical protein
MNQSKFKTPVVVSESVRAFLTEIGKKGGQIGGKAKSPRKLRAARKNLPRVTPELARKAAKARWEKWRQQRAQAQAQAQAQAEAQSQSEPVPATVQ